MSIDQEKLKRAKILANQKEKLSWDDISDEQKEEMRKRLTEGGLFEKLKQLWEDLQRGENSATESIEKIISIILGEPYP